MNTPAHLVVGLAAFGRPGRPAVTGAALAGSLIPDLSLYLLAGWHLIVLGTPARTVFGRLYHSDGWQAVFAVDNSLPLWALALALGLAWRRAWLVAGAGAAVLHLAADLALHHDDARRHFWPLTDWVFRSPVSYWDRTYHADLVAPVETALVLALCVWLWTRLRAAGWRALIAALALAQLAPALLWAAMF
ncbi:MAG: cobalamin biosynthesis protein CobQ [Hasllibacter sp.]